MMKFRGLLAMALAVGLFGFVAFSASAYTLKDPKYTIKQVMKAVEGKGALKDKVASGKATAAEKDKLVEYATALAETPCPKGDEESWKTKTKAFLEACKKVQAGEKDAVKAFGKANNCKGCHDAHK